MLANSRRLFLKNSFLSAGVLLLFPNQLFGAVSPQQTINLIQEDLFPFAQELEADTASYIQIVLNHSRVNDEEKRFIRNGIQWLNEESLKVYGKVYTALEAQKRQKILKIISKENWGENWLSSMLGYIMEATFSDKVYGVNKNEAGQKWLNHSVGLPRPLKALL